MPSFTITPVESMFSIIFCAVPLFMRVEPVMTSGPGAGEMAMSACASASQPGQHVTAIVSAPTLFA